MSNSRLIQRTRFTLIGVFAGLMFPLGALVIDWWLKGFEVPLWQIPQLNPIHYVIFSAPFVMGFMARLVGSREDHIREQQSILRQAHNELSERTSELRDIMGNIQEGLLTIDREGQINQEYSTILNKIFNSSDLAGKRFVELVYEPGRQKERQELEEYLQMLFDNQSASDSLIAELNPIASLDYAHSEHKGEIEMRHLQFQFVRIFLEKDLKKVLVIVRDVTSQIHKEKALVSEKAEHTAEIERVMALINAPLAEIDKLSQLSDACLSRLEQLLQKEPGNQLDLPQLRSILGELHSRKGESRLFGFQRMGEILHKIESKIRKLTELYENTNGPATDQELDYNMEIMLAASEARNYLADLQKTRNRVLSRVQEQSKGQVARDWLRHEILPHLQSAQNEISSLLQSVEGSLIDTTDKNDWTAVLEGLLQKSCQELKARGIERQISQLKIQKSLTDSQIAELKDLRPAVIHLLQNSLVHGIESPSERIGKGKTAAGQIMLSFKPVDTERIAICVQDDGRGIQTEAIRQRLKESRILEPERIEALSKQELIKHIFESGFSSAETITPVAGHGIGMDAVRSLIRKRAGQISVHNHHDQGLEICLYVKIASKANLLAKEEAS